jgi:hypothetical protein
MPKPLINATLNQLKNQSARGLEHGASPGSAGNIMPGPAATKGPPARMPSGGATAGTGGNPPRGGAPPSAKGSYQRIAGSPSPGGIPKPGSFPAPNPGSVRSHALALGGLKHMVAAGHIQPAHAKKMEATSRAHIASYGASKPKAPKAPRFGSLGGMGAMGGPGGAPSLGQAATGAGGQPSSGGLIPGTAMTGGTPLDQA